MARRQTRCLGKSCEGPGGRRSSYLRRYESLSEETKDAAGNLARGAAQHNSSYATADIARAARESVTGISWATAFKTARSPSRESNAKSTFGCLQLACNTRMRAAEFAF